MTAREARADPPRGEGCEAIVAIGGSAGSVQALKRAAAGMPADLPFAVLVAIHMSHRAVSVLADILDRSGPLTAVTARGGQTLRPGHIYVAVPDHHLLVDGSRVVLGEGAADDDFQPSLDALFGSVAVHYGRGAVGVLLSGVLGDGVAGLAQIRARGGTTVAQDPADALFPDMPLRAVHEGIVDRTVTAAGLGELLAGIAARL